MELNLGLCVFGVSGLGCADYRGLARNAWPIRKFDSESELRAGCSM